jgi:hypothetical protein
VPLASEILESNHQITEYDFILKICQQFRVLISIRSDIGSLRSKNREVSPWFLHMLDLIEISAQFSSVKLAQSLVSLFFLRKSDLYYPQIYLKHPFFSLGSLQALTLFLRFVGQNGRVQIHRTKNRGLAVDRIYWIFAFRPGTLNFFFRTGKHMNLAGRHLVRQTSK